MLDRRKQRDLEGSLGHVKLEKLIRIQREFSEFASSEERQDWKYGFGPHQRTK